jgi:subtilisin-like proprotein convertase family protein
MKKLLLLVLFSAFFSITGNSQNSMWTATSNVRISSSEKSDRTTMPSDFLLYHLNLVAFKTLLETASLDSSGQLSNLQVSFPNPDGTLENYLVYEAPVMEQGLALKYPTIKSYIAKGINDPTASMRFSITTFGLHAMLTSGRAGTFYIDSYTKDLQNYIVYSKKSIASTKPFSCLVQDEVDAAAGVLLKSQSTFANDGLFRQYRLAMACTIEYAAFHVNAAGLGAGTLAQKKAAVLAAMVVTMTRVNGIYEKDMSLRMNLVANNDLVIFIDSDSFDNDNANVLIDQSQPVIDANIGNGNYDIGHTVSTGDGGMASLGAICINSSKAIGITGSPGPVGDIFDVDYVAHEIGHQFGAEHTFNNSCDENRSDANAAEPGSGSTIMAYAGICSPNIQNNSDAYFHAFSIAQMTTRVLATSCAASTSNGNFAPVVDAGPDYTIPRGTAFILKGAATDANNDALTYCWEQTDVEISTQNPLQTSTSGPNFRSRSPISTPDRYMPRFEDVLNNNLAPFWEVVPNVARTMKFALTVRDNRTPNGGQTNRDDTVITTSSFGPFLVNAPNSNISWVAGSNQNVTWAVAGTDSNGINALFVDILLSTDGGLTFPILLASKVPNDGSETISVPNNSGMINRVMVRGYKHIFYDISNNWLSISAAPSSFAVAFSGIAETQNTSVCSTNTPSFTIDYTALGGFNSSTSFSATGTPNGSTVSFSPNPISTSGTVTMTLGNISSALGDFQIIVNATSGEVTKTVPFYLSILLTPVVLTSPANNSTGASSNSNLSWTSSLDATSYDVQVATNNTFTAIVSSGNVTTNSYSVTGLSANTTYFWRVLPKNLTCTGVYGSAFQFTTGSISCATTPSSNVPVSISASGTPTITSTLNIPVGASITDLNVILNISHTWISDLTVTLTSPTGTVVTLFTGICTDSDNAVATFDDSGVAIICGANPAISGTVTPNSSLAAFNGQNSTGVWTLTISDAFNHDGGALNSWSLNMCTSQPVVLWTGATNTDWSTATNWTNSLVPNGSYSIEIPLGNPILETSFTLQSGKNLKITGTGSLTLSPTANLNIQGNADFGGLPVTLQSNASGTASIGQVLGTILNATNVTVERYIPARRAWRILTAPLTATSGNMINVNWQGTSGEGVLLFSPDASMIGYVAGGNAPNIRKYNAGWQNINNLEAEPMFGDLATDTKAFLVFPTGPVGSGNIETGATETTLRPKGQLITGTVSHTSLAVNTFHVLANPYASAINPVDLITNNAGQKLWLIRSSIGNFGAYVTFDGTDWSLPLPAPSGSEAYIQSGQGFFVRSPSVNSFTIAESDKVSGSSNYWLLKNPSESSDVSTVDRIRVLLYKQMDNNWTIADGTLTVNYASGSNEVDAMDSNKISNFNESIMFRNAATSLSIEHRRLPQVNDIQNLRMTGTTALPYQLRVLIENYSNSTLLPILEDTVSGSFTALPVNGSEVIVPFTGVLATTTNPDNRFRIIYQTNLSNVDASPLVASVFPNPVLNNQLNVHLEANAVHAEYTITNLLGQFIQKGTFANTQNVITLSSNSEGFYILSIRQNGKSFTTKIYVQ